MKRMAFTDSLNRQPRACEHTMLVDRLKSISRASWIKAARWWL